MGYHEEIKTGLRDILHDRDLSETSKEDAICELLRDSEIVKKEYPKPEKPKHWPGRYNPGGERKGFYSYNWGERSPMSFRDSSDEFTAECRVLGICSETKEEAEFVHRQQAAYLELIDTIQELNEGWCPDWEDGGQLKHYFAYDYVGGALGVRNEIDSMRAHPDCEYMKNYVSPEVITKFGKTKIKLALWGIED